MYCPNCKTEFAAGKYCPECGAELIATPTMDSNPTAVYSWTTQSVYSGIINNTDIFLQAKMYEFGNGVNADIERAAQLYLQAAVNGSPYAMCHIGYLMLYSFGIERDVRNAMEWLRQGVSQSTDKESLYYKNAVKLLNTFTKAPNLPDSRQDCLARLSESVNGYNTYAEKHGFKTLRLDNDRILGPAVDDESIFFTTNDKQHYLNYSLCIPLEREKKGLSGFKQEFHYGYLGSMFVDMVRTVIAINELNKA